jgi:hypothetical protein
LNSLFGVGEAPQAGFEVVDTSLPLSDLLINPFAQVPYLEGKFLQISAVQVYRISRAGKSFVA